LRNDTMLKKLGFQQFFKILLTVEAYSSIRFVMIRSHSA